MAKEKLLRHIDIGGKIVRLTEDDDFYYVYEGKKLIYKFVKKYITKTILWKVVNDYSLYLKKLQSEFVDEDLPIDNLVAEAEKKIRNEFTKRLRDFFKQIPEASVKKELKEDFLGLKIFPNLTKVFIGFNLFINKTVKDVMKKLEVQVVDDVDDTGKAIDYNTKKLIKDKTAIMKKSIANQLTNTKDNILTDIKTSLSQGISAGQSVSTIRKDIEKKYNYKNGVGWKTQRTLKGTVNNANMVLKLNKWLGMGFTKFEWITRDDIKVRPKHAIKNHKVYDIKKALKDINNWDAYPGKSAGCRCSAIPYE